MLNLCKIGRRPFAKVYVPNCVLPCTFLNFTLYPNESQTLFEVAVHRASFGKDHECVGIDAVYDLLDLIDFVLGDHDEEDIGCFVGVCAFSIPVGDAPAGLLHDCFGDAGLLGEDHDAGVDILNVYPVDGDGEYRRVDQGVHYDFYIK